MQTIVPKQQICSFTSMLHNLHPHTPLTKDNLLKIDIHTHILPATWPNLRERYGLNAGGAYLLRPDQHVCARWAALDASRLRAALHTAIGLNTGASS